MQSIVGEQSDLGRVPVGYFTDGSPMANKAGLGALSSPRDIALAKKLVADQAKVNLPC